MNWVVIASFIVCLATFSKGNGELRFFFQLLKLIKNKDVFVKTIYFFMTASMQM